MGRLRGEGSPALVPRSAVSALTEGLERAKRNVSGGSAPTLEVLERGLAAAPFGLLVADARQPDFPVVWVSEGVERLTGYSADEVLGRNARMFHGRFGKQPALEVVRRAIADGEPCDVVLANERKDGTTFWNRLLLTPVRDELGAISHVVGIQKDVTERQELLARVRAAQSSETSQQMLGGAVHDLRNMLTVVAAQIGLARDEVREQPDVAEALDAANEALEQAASLTRLLLAPVTRGQSGAGSSKLEDVLRAMAAVGRYVLPRAVTLEVHEPEDGEAWVVGERGALEQVLLNLLLNAAEAMPAGGSISVRAHRGIPEEIATHDERTSTAGYWTLSVADSGPGMPEEVLARLFEPYFTTKPAGRGTGLGLATCSRLVQAAGGFVRVRSRAAVGSTFYVSLPSAAPAGSALDHGAPTRDRPGISRATR